MELASQFFHERGRMLEILWLCFYATGPSYVPSGVTTTCQAQDRAYAPYTMTLTENVTTHVWTLTVTSRQNQPFPNHEFEIALFGPSMTLRPENSYLRGTFTQSQWNDKGTPTSSYVGHLRFSLLGATIPSGYTLDPIPSDGFCATRCLSIPPPTVPSEILTFKFDVGASGGGLNITNSSVPSCTAGAAYNQTLSATGGTAPYTWTVASGTLPTGLSLSSGGVISGTCGGSGPSSFTVMVTDSASSTDTQALSITVTVTLTITTTCPLPTGPVGVAYSQTVAANSGTPPYSFDISAGSLPPGLSLATSGALTGTPTTANPYTFTLRVTDAVPSVVTKSCSMTINPPDPLTISATPAALMTATLGVSVSSIGFTPSGGTAPYTCNILSGGDPPDGVTLSGSTCALTGTPTLVGDFPITAEVVDSAATSANTTAIIQVRRPNGAATVESAANAGSTKVVIALRKVALNANQSCAIAVLDPSGNAISSAALPAGPAVRTAVLYGLTAGVDYTWQLSCGNSLSGFGLFSTPAPTGTRAIRFVGAAPSGASKVRVQYRVNGDSVYSSTTATCSACAVSLPDLNRGSVYDIRHDWLDGSDNVLRASGVRQVVVQ